jgi:hypothetical protein
MCLDYEQQSENTKLALLWLDCDQELNTKDVEDFFQTGINRPAYDQWFSRYALSKWTNAVIILLWVKHVPHRTNVVDHF